MREPPLPLHVALFGALLLMLAFELFAYWPYIWCAP